MVIYIGKEVGKQIRIQEISKSSKIIGVYDDFKNILLTTLEENEPIEKAIKYAEEYYFLNYANEYEKQFKEDGSLI